MSKKGFTYSFAFRFLNWFCPSQLLEEIEGDLLQRFDRDVVKFGEGKANRRLLWNIIRFFRPGILLRSQRIVQSNHLRMLSNYFKTTYRYAGKNKLSFSFRLGGLTLALFSFLVIAIYVAFQLSFDKFHDNHKNIYRVNSSWREGDKEVTCASVPSAMGAALKAEFPEVKSYAIVSEWGDATINVENKLFRCDSFLEAESSVFDVFTFKFISGDKTALARPRGIVITQSFASQFFGNDDPMHKLISFPDEYNRTLEVRAVIADLPPNSSLDVKAIIGYGALRDIGDGELYSWNIGYGGNLFVELNDHANPDDFQNKIKPFLAKNIAKSADSRESTFSVFFQPLFDIYMGESLRWELNRKGNPIYLYVYVSLSIFLLVIASINYLNLSVADFSSRNKEIGVRKVLGARKNQIVFQITFETVFHCLLALTISGLTLYIVFPQISHVLDFNGSFSILFQSGILLWVLATIVILIIASAAYPAYCLAVNNPIHDLKRKQVVGGKLSVNSVLLAVQFVISIFCLSATWVVSDQLKYIQTKDIGFERNNLLELFLPYRFPLEKAPVIKEEISKVAGVQSTSFSYYHVTAVPYFNAWYKIQDGNEMKQVMLNELFADEDFIETMKLTLVAGRNFKSKSEFKSSFIVNESAVKEFGWTDAIGKRIAVGHDKEPGGIWSEGTVIGVVKDFNTRSLHKKIEPLVLRLQYDDWPGSILNVRYSGSEKEAIKSIQKVYQKVLPEFLMNSINVNERYNRQCAAESKAFTTMRIATWIILLISSVGIFSMSLFMSFRRQKEFGIRKVVGASETQIASLHISHFLKIALIANVFAVPMAYLIMNSWLREFAYRTEISGFALLLLGSLLLLLVAFSAGYSALKSARMNPVDVIKAE